MSNESVDREQSCRRFLTTVVASLCLETGYESAEEAVIETLSEMLQSYLCEVANTARSYYEHSGRTQPTGHDVMCALADLGFCMNNLAQYLHKTRRFQPGQPSRTLEPPAPAVLQVGKRKSFPSFIPDTYNYPPLPDPHAYIRTSTGQKPETDYVILRERLSMQKRDVERALTRFVAKTGQSHPLLPHDKNAFPLILAQPSSYPYLSALLPSEHETLNLNTEPSEKDVDSCKDTKSKRSLNDDEETSQETNKPSQSTVIRNPYLRPVKKPKSKRKT